jgi:HNH endonuclease
VAIQPITAIASIPTDIVRLTGLVLGPGALVITLFTPIAAQLRGRWYRNRAHSHRLGQPRNSTRSCDLRTTGIHSAPACICAHIARDQPRERQSGFPVECGPSPRASLAIGTEAGIHREVDGGGMSPRLEPRAYRELRNQVLERDRWRCQWCGSLAGVEVHHLVPRSRAGADSTENLIALCAAMAIPLVLSVFAPFCGRLLLISYIAKTLSHNHPLSRPDLQLRFP